MQYQDGEWIREVTTWKLTYKAVSRRAMATSWMRCNMKASSSPSFSSEAPPGRRDGLSKTTWNFKEKKLKETFSFPSVQSLFQLRSFVINYHSFHCGRFIVLRIYNREILQKNNKLEYVSSTTNLKNVITTTWNHQASSCHLTFSHCCLLFMYMNPSFSD